MRSKVKISQITEFRLHYKYLLFLHKKNWLAVYRIDQPKVTHSDSRTDFPLEGLTFEINEALFPLQKECGNRIWKTGPGLLCYWQRGIFERVALGVKQGHTLIYLINKSSMPNLIIMLIPTSLWMDMQIQTKLSSQL